MYLKADTFLNTIEYTFKTVHCVIQTLQYPAKQELLVYLMLTSSIHRTNTSLFVPRSVRGDKTVYTLHTACMCVFDTRNPASPHRYKRPKPQIPAGISEHPESTETTSQNHRSKMKAWFVLFLLLLPLCMGK